MPVRHPDQRIEVTNRQSVAGEELLGARPLQRSEVDAPGAIPLENQAHDALAEAALAVKK
jgi:hypothetical protein